MMNQSHTYRKNHQKISNIRIEGHQISPTNI
jgi:hypothetical protein